MNRVCAMTFLLAIIGPLVASAQERVHEEPVSRTDSGVVAAPTATATTQIADPSATDVSVPNFQVPAAPVARKPVVARAIVARGSGGSGNGPRPADIYVTVSCAFAEDPSDKCREGVAEATEAITDSMAEEAASDVSRGVIKVHFTAFLDRAEQLKTLRDMEFSAIHAMELHLNLQLKALTPFQQPLRPWVAQVAIEQDERALAQINFRARMAAVESTNWNHDWPVSTHTYTSSVYNKPESWHLSPELQHEYDCAGAGNKPGCSWDGRTGQTLYSK